MKKILSLFIVSMLTGVVAAQVNFRSLSWQETLETARTEKKLVFVDCYTAWCGPCKRLAKEVFPQTKVGEFFNSRFVSIQIDMEKGEGPDLRIRYDVNAFPTLLVLDADGKLMWRFAGYLNADELIANVRQGLEANPLLAMEKRYQTGERSLEFIGSYLAMLEDQAMSSTQQVVCDDFFRDKADAVFTDPGVYKLFAHYVKSPKGETFRKVYARKDEYASRYGEEAALRLEMIWQNYGGRCLKYADKKVVGYDRDVLEACYRLMKQCQVPEAEAIRAKYQLQGAAVTQDWPLLLQALPVYATFSRVDEWNVYHACNALSKASLKPAERQEWIDFLRKRIETLQGIKDTSGRTMTVNGERLPLLEYFRRSYEKILLQKLN